MIGAIIGDIVGSAYINRPVDANNFQLLLPQSAYTDDTVLTLSTADALLNKESFTETLRKWTRAFPKAGYREEFLNWALSEKDQAYISSGNGAARRISPIGLAASSLDEALKLAEETTIVTHNWPLKIKASKAIAGSIFLAKNYADKNAIKEFAERIFEFNMPDLNHVTSICPIEESPVPAAILSFLTSDCYESAIKNALQLGGPTNTLASIAGGLAHAHYRHIPKAIIRKSLSRLTPSMMSLIETFQEEYFNIEADSSDRSRQLSSI
jgi:ADP-ribosylglycohydrolase